MTAKIYKVFTINPGSTSTKIALFHGDEKVFAQNIDHQASELSQFHSINDQLEYRYDVIRKVLAENKVDLTGTDAFSARGGGTCSVEGGVYGVNERLIEDQRSGQYVQHPAALGAQLAELFKKEYGGIACIVNAPDVDEFTDIARITGIKGVYRQSKIHALNQKEMCIRLANDRGQTYSDLNIIVAHIGGGVSVTAHEKGIMVDSNDIAHGEGPMAPTRIGYIPAASMLKLCESEVDTAELKLLLTKSGGLVSHLGTSDAREVGKMINDGSRYAKIVYDAFIYQIAKEIGAMAAVLKGKVDAIILTGGISHDKYVVDTLHSYIGYIAEIAVMPGEFEMEALAAGAIRVMSGKEDIKTYTGNPVWSAEKFEKAMGI